MMKNTGTADLPLHNGSAPRWLFKRMVRLSQGIVEVMIEEHGRKEFLRRLTDPNWFQAFACTIGFDWHSSGTTTTTCGALKVALDAQKHGILVAGGKGSTSRKAPSEIEEVEDIFSIEPKRIETLTEASKLSATVDNSCVQDDYDIYHHCFFAVEDGDWGVVQQGMKGESGYARRYHWLSDELESYVNEPHEGVCCERKENEVLDMTASDSEPTRDVSVDLINDNPDHLRRYLDKGGQTSLTDFTDEPEVKRLELAEHHPVLDMDISSRGWKDLKRAYEVQPSDYEELVSLKGIGPKKVRALALVSNLIYGTEASWDDPVKYSFAHGGKDGTPYPVDREVYDSTIQVMEEQVKKAEVSTKDKKKALERLSALIEKEG